MKTAKIKFVNKDKTQFFNVLKERVDNYFIENHISQHANATMVFKTIVMLSLYFVPYAFIMSNTLPIAVFYTCWGIMGLGLAGIGMSVMHDANHGAYSSSPFINQMISLSLTFVGGDNKNWKTQHNILHHTYTNIHGHDRDIDNKVIMRFAPSGKFYKVQRFQVFYVFVFYSIMTLYWTTAKDLVQYFEFIKHGHNREGRKDRLITLGRILFWKVIYIAYIFVLPVMFLNVAWWQVLLGFLLLHGIAGIILSVVFQLAHVVEDTTFPTPDANGNIENEWAIHQLETTADFARDNKLITYYVGGLNYQAIHHLFPRICHVHYPKIAPIVEATAKEFGVPYLYNETFGKALASHIRIIQKLGKRDVSFSAVMNSMG